MSRWVIALLFTAAASLYAQDTPPPQPPDKTTPPPEMKRDRPRKATSDKEEVPPEEDASLTRDDYSFNPMQSQRDVTVGDEYRKKGNLIAAARRYQTATLRNDGNSQAWLKLGETRQKMKDAPVSYTHLDVYKRQTMRDLEGLMLGMVRGQDPVQYALGPGDGEVAMKLEHGDFGLHQVGTVNLYLVVALGQREHARSQKDEHPNPVAQEPSSPLQVSSGSDKPSLQL